VISTTSGFSAKSGRQGFLTSEMVKIYRRPSTVHRLARWGRLALDLALSARQRFSRDPIASANAGGITSTPTLRIRREPAKNPAFPDRRLHLRPHKRRAPRPSAMPSIKVRKAGSPTVSIAMICSRLVRAISEAPPVAVASMRLRLTICQRCEVTGVPYPLCMRAAPRRAHRIGLVVLSTYTLHTPRSHYASQTTGSS
jgi:hypothetical protein